MAIAPPEDAEGRGRALRVRSSCSRLALDKALQTAEGLVPLCRNHLQMPACLRETPLFQLPETLATVRRAAHETGVFHDPQVLGDRLTGDGEAGGQLRNRHRPGVAEARHQAQPG